MEAHGDKMATTQADLSNSANPHLCTPHPKRGKHGKPAATAKFGSASVPIYRCNSGGRIRFAISHYRDGKRLRQFFTTLEAAKKEGLFVAQRIQAGMQHVTDLKPHERDNYAKALQLLADSGIPLVAAIEDFVNEILAVDVDATADERLAFLERKPPRHLAAGGPQGKVVFGGAVPIRFG